MKQHQLHWHPEEKGRDKSGKQSREKYKPVHLTLAETEPHDAIHTTRDGNTYILNVDPSAELGSQFHVPLFISRRQRRLLMTTCCFVGSCAFLSGVALVLLVQGLTNSLDSEEEHPQASGELTPHVEASDNCTLTFDPDDISELMREAFVNTFFNMTCLATNGTGDPCDLHIAEEYTYGMFRDLRIGRLVGEFITFVAIFSFAQFGGIPRPTDWNGVFFWSAWMMTQLAQHVVILCALLLQVCSFLGVRARLAP